MTSDGQPVRPRPPSLEAVREIIEASARHSRQRERTRENSPYRIAAHPAAATPRDPALTMAMDSALLANLDWATSEWLGGGQLTANVDDGLVFLGYPYLAELAQRPEYRTISETIATEATRKWIKFQATTEAKKREREEGQAVDRAPSPFDDLDRDEEPEAGESGGKPEGESDQSDQEKEDQEKANRAKADRIKELNDEMERLHVREHMATIAINDGFFGRSHLYLNFGEDTDGSDDAKLKLPIGNGRDEVSKKIATPQTPLNGIKVIEPVWTYPLQYNAANPFAPNFYRPDYWYVMGKQIHRTRLLTFVARPVPDMLKPAYSFGGLSLSQIAKPYIDIWLKTRQSVAEIVRSFSVMVLKTDLATMMQPHSASSLMARVALFNQFRDNQGTFVVNNGTEDFANVSAPLGGLDHLQAQAQEHCASIARIPLVKYTGITPSGLNASSEGEIRVWYDTVSAFQESYFRPNLTTLIDFIMLSLWGEVDPDIGFEFVPLWSLSEKERAEKQKQDADRNQIYIDSGTISPEEVRKVLIDDPELPFTALDPDDVPELKEEEMGGLVPEGSGGGLEALMGGGKPPPGGAGGKGEEPGGAGDAVLPFAGAQDDAEWQESDHPRRDDGKFGAGGGGATGGGEKPAGEAPEGGEKPSSAEKGAEPDDQPVYKTKHEQAAAMLEKGTTAKELMAALGWPSISVPATAKSVGMKLEKIKQGRETLYKGIWMSPLERKAAGLMPEGVRRSGGPRARDPDSWSLLEFIADKGGIDPRDALIGDVRSVFGTKNKFIPGFGTLIRPGGFRLDRLREAAVEAGYMHDPGRHTGGLSESTISQLLDAMDSENRGDRIYRYGYKPEHVLKAEQERGQELYERERDELINDAVASFEIPALSDKQRNRVIELMEKEGIRDPIEAIEREAMEWLQDASEREEAERVLDDVPGWDVPDDARAAPQSGRAAIPF